MVRLDTECIFWETTFRLLLNLARLDRQNYFFHLFKKQTSNLIRRSRRHVNQPPNTCGNLALMVSSSGTLCTVICWPQTISSYCTLILCACQPRCFVHRTVILHVLMTTSLHIGKTAQTDCVAGQTQLKCTPPQHMMSSQPFLGRAPLCVCLLWGLCPITSLKAAVLQGGCYHSTAEVQTQQCHGNPPPPTTTTTTITYTNHPPTQTHTHAQQEKVHSTHSDHDLPSASLRNSS